MRWEDGETIVIEKDDLVSHAVGTSGQRGNWKAYWCEHTNRQWPKCCQILGCAEPAKVGAHIYVKRLHQTFILPTCYECNGDRVHDYPNWVSAKCNAIAVRIHQYEGIYEDV